MFLNQLSRARYEIRSTQKTNLYMYIYFFIQVSSWSAWGSCSAPPGRCSTNSGTRTRTRRVTLSPSCGGSSCPTLTQKSQCTPVPIPCKVILIICCLFVKCFLYIYRSLKWIVIFKTITREL